ncbi:MAG: hypothetical protein QM619_13065 [Micropruina sp.]|uniref:hypothetical protein n=1 Tax=Micropruina sp. TaxID=2737536 RepID=UPI0039E47A66
MWRHRNHSIGPRQPWSRQRLLLGLTTAGLMAVTVLLGVALAIAQAVSGGSWPPVTTRSADGPSGPATVAPATVEVPGSSAVREGIAAAPMVVVPSEAAVRPDPALTPAPPIRVPDALDGRGPAGIPMFPHTYPGAVAQLAAIDVAVLEAMSIPRTVEVHQVWVLPGGPAMDVWDVAANVAAFLRSSRQGSSIDPATMVRVRPVGAMVKGTDGPDWLVACVLLDVTATIRAEARMGWGHCARMQWADGRWQIAPGVAPALAPSAWPGSKAAVAAGWLSWLGPEGA